MSSHVRGGVAYNSAEEADLAAEIPTVYLDGKNDAGFIAEAVLDSDWLRARELRVRQDLMLEFFERFTATGSVSVTAIRRWWDEKLRDQ